MNSVYIAAATIESLINLFATIPLEESRSSTVFDLEFNNPYIEVSIERKRLKRDQNAQPRKLIINATKR